MKVLLMINDFFDCVEQNDGDNNEVYFVEAFGKRRHREAPFG